MLHEEKFLSVLYEGHHIPKDLYERLLSLSTKEKKPLIPLLQENLIPFIIIQAVFKESFGISSIDLTTCAMNPQVLQLITHDLALRNMVFPIKIENNKLLLAMENPLDTDTIDTVAFVVGMRVVPLFVASEQLQRYLHTYYIQSKINSIESQFISNEHTLKEPAKPYTLDMEDLQSTPVVKLIDSILESAVSLRASDIHIEPIEDKVRTRYRIDGHLKEIQSVSIALLPNIISRIKVMANMDISERRLPQDGHFKKNTNGVKLDFRISTVPSVFGEKAVIRIIYNQVNNLEKNQLGFFDTDLERLEQLINIPYGMILVTGPTGSGKTTTLANFIKQRNDEDIHIVTVEDPVEHIIPGVTQIPVNTKSGLTFSRVLPYILRQDPDVLMIGEIRDHETAQIAIRSSITGHLVFSTLHTNDALSTITRLIDMGIEDYLVTAAVKCIISQRLVRRLCPHCKKETIIPKAQAKILKVAEDTLIFESVGCEKCNHIGYMGRFAVYEILVLDTDFTQLLENHASTEQIKQHLQQIGFTSIWACALKNVLLGNTSVSEMLKILFLF